MKLCKCGCGVEIKDSCTWVKGHHRKGITHTEEVRERLRQSKLGKPSWNRGIPRTEEEKAKMRAGIKEASKKAASERMKKLWANGSMDNFKGERNPSKRPDVAAKIGEANRKRRISEGTIEKMRKARIGKPGLLISEDAKKRSSRRMKVNNPMYRKEVLDKHPVLQSGPNFLSSGENKLAVTFNLLNLEFVRQFKIKKLVGYYVVDFFFPEQRKVIEFDGHYSHQEFPEKDKARDKYILDTYGFSTLRILPPKLNNTNIDNLIQKVKGFLNETYTIEN